MASLEFRLLYPKSQKLPSFATMFSSFGPNQLSVHNPKKNSKISARFSVTAAVAIQPHKMNGFGFGNGGEGGSNGGGKGKGGGGSGGGSCGGGAGDGCDGECRFCNGVKFHDDDSDKSRAESYKRTGYAKYKLSEISIFTGFKKRDFDSVYNLAQLEKEIECIAERCEEFQEVYLQQNPKNDGTIEVIAMIITKLPIRLPIHSSSGFYTKTKPQLQKLLKKGGALEAGTSPDDTIGLRVVPEEAVGNKVTLASWLAGLSLNWREKQRGFTIKQRSDNVGIECGFIPGYAHPQTSLGGTASLEHHILGSGSSVIASAALSNLFSPQDDIAGKLEVVHPYIDGTTFCGSAFGSRKFSPVLPSEVDQDPPHMWVDRNGLKANVTKNFKHQTHTYGMVWEDIRPGPDGQQPPTASTSGNHVLYLHGNVKRDATELVNGMTVGNRFEIKMDHGLGYCGRFPAFNRFQLIFTNFFQLKKVEEGVGKPRPPVLVLHGHYGRCVGELPRYDAFILGGPYSLRGYGVGEIGAAKNILTVAAELRLALSKYGQAYIFAEHGNDLTSSKGKRTKVQGSSCGLGATLGPLRAELAVNLNTLSSNFTFGFGERF